MIKNEHKGIIFFSKSFAEKKSFNIIKYVLFITDFCRKHENCFFASTITYEVNEITYFPEASNKIPFIIAN